MSDFALIAAVSILTAGLSVAFGAIGPALGEGRAAAASLAGSGAFGGCVSESCASEEDPAAAAGAAAAGAAGSGRLAGGGASAAASSRVRT